MLHVSNDVERIVSCCCLLVYLVVMASGSQLPLLHGGSGGTGGSVSKTCIAGATGEPWRFVLYNIGLRVIM